MSVEQPKPLVVTLEDIADFYLEKGVKDICSMCGTDIWLTVTAMQEEEIQYIAPPLFTAEGKPTGKGPKLTALMCMNCGNIRFQHLGPILDWKRANGRG